MAELSQNPVLSQLRSITKDSFSSELDRRAALAEANDLIHRLSTPWETAMGYVWVDPARMACLQAGVELDLFKKWKSADDTPKSLEELSKLVNCDKVLLRRILDYLAATNMLNHFKPGVYGLTPFTAALAEPPFSALPAMYTLINGPVTSNLPKYLASVGFKEDLSVSNNVQHMTGTGAFEWMQSDPKVTSTFGMAMGSYAANRPPLAQVYPTQKLLDATDPDSVILVDIGGSIGHDISSFHKAHPQPPGKLIVQDRPEVIENIDTLDTAITRMPHDFFTTQPVKGAKAYYMHFILHDWTDEKCKDILDNLKPAFKKGYSKLLIHEVVIDPTVLKDIRTTVDIHMLAMQGSHERTADEWSKLLGGSGFKIQEIYHNSTAMESVIEADLA